MEKLLVGYIAAMMTEATLSQAPMPTSAAGQDPVMARQVQACQVFVNWYEWVKNLLTDQNWPTPVVDSTWLTKAIAAALGTPVPTPAPTPAPELSGGHCAACRRTRRLITSTAFRRRGRTR